VQLTIGNVVILTRNLKQTGMTVDSLLRMFWLEVRNRDKMELINSIGDKKLYKIIKRVILSIEPAL